MKIRKATIKDIEGILKMSGEFIEEYRKSIKMKTKVSVNTALKFKREIFNKDLRSGHGAIFVSEENGKFIGYVFALTCPPGMEKMRKHYPGYISDLHVCKKYRRKGLGIKLVRQAEKWLWGKGKNSVSLDVEAFNGGAIGLYRKLKFIDKTHLILT